jgi:NAD(P)-dependent dehydrogenase (short-subunit alcohol dehydrogenase family)
VSEPIRFDGRAVVVTGAGRGLGRAYARLFARLGARVLVHDAGVARDGSGGDPAVAAAVVAEIEAHGGRAAASGADLCDRGGCEQVVSDAVEALGGVDVLVHNAGLVDFAGIEEQEPAVVERILAVQAVAPFWLCRAVWPLLRERGSGRIVLTVSGVALGVDRALPDVSPYALGKAAQFGLMNSLAVEGEPHGIRVNAISPVAATRMHRGPAEEGELSPELVAPAVAFLASDACDRSGLVVRAADGRFSVGAYDWGPELDLGRIPVGPEDVRDALPALLRS